MKQRTIVSAETVTLRYQAQKDGVPLDITGCTFRLGVKERLSDAEYVIGPIEGALDDAGSGMFSFGLTGEDTDVTPFSGLYEIAMFDSLGNKNVLTPAGGVIFRVVGEIVD